MLLIWILVFVVSLIVLVKGADWLLLSSERMGKAIGLSPFVVGVLIVGIGTSLPELASSIAAIIAGTPEIVSANAIGSNIANILLVVGFSAVIGRGLVVTKNLIDLDIPLLAIVTTFFLGIAIDGSIVFGEALLLIALFVIYTVYIIKHTDIEDVEVNEKEKITPKDFALFVVGIIALLSGAKYLIDSVIEISTIIGIGVGIISLAAVALGTSLPELIVSLKAAATGKAEVALGNIFGSNVFNLLLVIGLPGLFATLPLDQQTLLLGLPVMIGATVLFVISGISRKIHSYEGAMYLVVYVFFIGKLFGLI